MRLQEFKRKFRENVVSVGYVVFTIVLAASIFLAVGVFFLVLAIINKDTVGQNKIWCFVFSAICFVCFFFFAVITPMLVAVYPKYKKITHSILQERLFVTQKPSAAEERAAETPVEETTRVLTVERQKSFVSSLGKLKICIEDRKGEIELNGVRYRQLGTLKNGEAKSFDIPTRACRVCAFYDIASAIRYGFACKQLPEGEEDISLTGKAHLSPTKGNPFLFE